MYTRSKGLGNAGPSNRSLVSASYRASGGGIVSKGRERRQFDLVELFFIALFVGLCVWYFAQRTEPPLRYTEYTTLQEAGRLRAAYGPGHYSENQEEWIIRDFFKDRREGFFVDVGASHYRNNSNTFYLETRLGWSGIAIDPQAVFEADYRTSRPRTRFFPLFVSDVSNETARLYMAGPASLSASANRDFARIFGNNVTESVVPTITLTDLLTHLQIAQIDLLSVDVELSEPRVLAGFDIDRFKPTLVCIEALRDVRQQILNYFAKHGYVAVGRYLRVDVQNLYFIPLAAAADR
jgi:FkbM family methyltransferase